VDQRLSALLAEHAELEQQMADPATHAAQGLARTVGRRYQLLVPLAEAAHAAEAARDDAAAGAEMAAEDPAFAAELPALDAARAQADAAVEAALTTVLRPHDDLEGRDVILEIKAGEGGEESALFAQDLLRMYTRFAERAGWRTEVLDATPTDMGGVKDATMAVRGETAWAGLRREAGVHRVQRVPVTESQGRIHTSAAGVLVLPEAEDVEVSIDPNDLRIDVYRSSGPGGQSVNTTDSAVRMTHLPTGIVVAMQNEKSQLQNREAALRVMRSRLLARAQEEAQAAAAAARGAQVRTVDRSERIRTYNFKENRVSDHRVGYTAYNLDAVLDGDLTVLVTAVEEGLARQDAGA